MIMFQFMFSDEFSAEISALSQGHLIVRGQSGECSSQAVNRPVMLIPSVTELLAGLRSFLTNMADKQFNFCGIDAFFDLKFVRQKTGNITIYCGSKVAKQHLIAITNSDDLIRSVWAAAQSLQTAYSPYIGLHDKIDHQDSVAEVKSDLNQVVVAAWETDINLEFDRSLRMWLEAFPTCNEQE